MSESIDILAWNANATLGQPEKAPQAIEGIKRADANVLILSDTYSGEETEAVGWRGSQLETAYESMEALQTHGYDFRDVRYDRTWWRDRHMIIGARDSAATLTERQFGGRSTAEVKLGEVSIIGCHLFDTNREDRGAQVDDMLAYVETLPKDSPVILVGDMNEMWASTLQAKILRSPVVSGLAAMVPHARIRSLGTRLSDMAHGENLRKLAKARFIDPGDPRATTMSMGPLGVNLDRFMVRGIPEEALVASVFPKSVSDHRAITLQIKK